MRHEAPLDPVLLAELDAIDATLAGDPVDPAHAELAELALLLAAGRPQPAERFAARLDAQVARPAPAAPSSGAAEPKRKAPRWRSRQVLGGSLAAGLAVAAVGLVIVGSASQPASMSSSAVSTASSTSASASASQTPAGSADALRATSATSASAASGGAVSRGPTAYPLPAARQPGRQVISSAQLALSTPPTHVEDVAGELFGVVGSEHGYVQSSSVTQTGGPDGSARLELSLPSGNLPNAMAELSRLRYAHVGSRTDASTDVTDQAAVAGRRLADARALRAALLRALAGATTPGQLDSLRGRLHDADSAISAAEQQVATLAHRVAFSSVTVTIAAAGAPVAHHSSGLTVGRALHDAARVLSGAGAVLVLVAAILAGPLLLLAGTWWLLTRTRRRRREQALDLAG